MHLSRQMCCGNLLIRLPFLCATTQPIEFRHCIVHHHISAEQLEIQAAIPLVLARLIIGASRGSPRRIDSITYRVTKRTRRERRHSLATGCQEPFSQMSGLIFRADDVKNQERYGDSEHTVAERLQPIGIRQPYIFQQATAWAPVPVFRSGGFPAPCSLRSTILKAPHVTRWRLVRQRTSRWEQYVRRDQYIPSAWICRRALDPGADLTVGGIFQAVHALWSPEWKARVLSIVIGLLFVAGGILLMLNPLTASSRSRSVSPSCS